MKKICKEKAAKKIYQIFEDGEILLTTADAAKALKMLQQLLDEYGFNDCFVNELVLE